MANGGQTNSQAAKGGSVYDQSAAAMQDSGQALQQAGDVISNSQLQGDAATYDPTTGTAAQAADPNTIASGIEGYMNPYTQQVIDNAQADVTRQLNMQLDNIGANAANSGAFGGSRHGLVEGQAMSEAQRNIGNLSSNLLNSAYGQAAGLSAQDIQNQMGNNQFNANLQQNMGLANMNAENTAGAWNAGAQNAWDLAQAQQGLGVGQSLIGLGQAGQNLAQGGFDMGQALTQNQLQAGGMQQQLLQNLMNLAGGQYQGFTQNPNNMLNILLNSAGMSPLNQATTTTGTTTPGMFDYLSLAGQTYGASKGAPT